MLLPQMIRESFPSISIGFFLHIPFPSYEIFRTLPWREQLLNGPAMDGPETKQDDIDAMFAGDSADADQDAIDALFD